MNQKSRLNDAPRGFAQSGPARVPESELVQLYLTMPRTQRDKRFAGTARAAERAGLSRRTIQFWIETGAIQAIPVGRKYKVDLDSLKDYLVSQSNGKAGAS